MHDGTPVSRDQFAKLIAVTVPEIVPLPPRSRSAVDWAVIRQGFRPRDMDDRWIAFVEHDRLFLHRSWTGLGVYEAQFAQVAAGWSISELLVTGDRDNYRRSSDAWESAFTEAIIDGVLLGHWDGESQARLRDTPRATRNRPGQPYAS